ncbi:MAG: MFS transporter, partial [Gammaproteobacteria bacterium]
MAEMTLGGGQRGTVPLERRPVFWFYGSASIAYGIKDNAFSYLLLIFANQVLGVPGYLASLALAIAMLWDAVSDLLLGHWSDKTHSRLGRRHPFMYAALLVLPPSFYALFNPVIDVSGEAAFWYVLALALVIRTGTTLFEVPSTALLPDLERDYDRRNKWLALRHGFGWYGGNGVHTLNFFFWVGAFG